MLCRQDEQEIWPDVAFTIAEPVTAQSMVSIALGKWVIFR